MEKGLFSDPLFSPGPSAVQPVDVIITGINTILPLISEEILKVGGAGSGWGYKASCSDLYHPFKKAYLL